VPLHAPDEGRTPCVDEITLADLLEVCQARLLWLTPRGAVDLGREALRALALRGGEAACLPPDAWRLRADGSLELVDQLAVPRRDWLPPEVGVGGAHHAATVQWQCAALVALLAAVDLPPGPPVAVGGGLPADVAAALSTLRRGQPRLFRTLAVALSADPEDRYRSGARFDRALQDAADLLGRVSDREGLAGRVAVQLGSLLAMREADAREEVVFEASSGAGEYDEARWGDWVREQAALGEERVELSGLGDGAIDEVMAELAECVSDEPTADFKARIAALSLELEAAEDGAWEPEIAEDTWEEPTTSRQERSPFDDAEEPASTDEILMTPPQLATLPPLPPPSIGARGMEERAQPGEGSAGDTVDSQEDEITELPDVLSELSSGAARTPSALPAYPAITFPPKQRPSLFEELLLELPGMTAVTWAMVVCGALLGGLLVLAIMGSLSF